MAEFDVAAFVTRMEQLGLRLSVVPLADGKIRINRWHMLEAVEHARQIKDLWASQIGENQARINLLASHLEHRMAAPLMVAERNGGVRKPEAAPAAKEPVGQFAREPIRQSVREPLRSPPLREPVKQTGT
jgi:hypothetical protein